MKKFTVAIAAAALLACIHATSAGTMVQFTVSCVLGTAHFDVDLFDQDAPVTVSNFLSYVNSGGYDGTILHRVYGVGSVVNILQGGGYLVDYDPATPPTHILQSAPIVNEYALPSAHSNVRGTIAMARTSGFDTATSEWFINTTDNTAVGAVASGNPNWDDSSNPYCVFGQVLDDPADAPGTLTGMSLIDYMAQSQYWYSSVYPSLSSSDPRYAAPIAVNAQQTFYSFFSVTAAVVPEPASLLLLSVGAVCVLGRQRRSTR